VKTPGNIDRIAGQRPGLLGPDTLPNRVCVVEGYGLSITIERRHLLVRDGAGTQRRERRYPRIGHNLDRIVIVGHAGTISLEAIRWIDRVGITLVHLDRDHSLLSGTLRPGLDDARLRRAQALAADSAVGVTIAAQLIAGKLDGQAANLRRLRDSETANEIGRLGAVARDAITLNEIRDAEARAAHVYFDAWSGTVRYQWAPKDLHRIPERWQQFARRHSPLASGPTRAGDPVNATLNYLYALAEVECRLACLTLGLDPGLGIVHNDKKGRDSLALDLIEPVRPAVDAYVLELASDHLFRADDFTEQDDGHCRILPPLTHHLAATLALWRQAVAPWAEAAAFALAEASPYVIRKATPLTSTVRRERSTNAAESRRRGRGRKPPRERTISAALPSACIECGQLLVAKGRVYCADCLAEHRDKSRRAGREVSRSMLVDPVVRTARGTAISKAKTAGRSARASALGVDPELWERHLAPRIGVLTLREIMDATGHQISHASRIKTGVRIPNPQHWPALQDAIRRSDARASRS
jgi:CRISPR-associated endonuclease Cas1